LADPAPPDNRRAAHGRHSAALQARRASSTERKINRFRGDLNMAGAPKAEGGHPAMDYAEHDRTYDGFIRFSTIGTIWCLIIVVGLAIGATGKSWGMGSLMIALGTAAGAVGLFSKAIDYKGVAGVLILSLLIWAAKALH
jgi:hypothetical protein